MHYIWFWTFWHWSKESFRSRIVLRAPLQGIAGHWDEWFCHEASESDRRAIQQVGKTESMQRQFILWLRRHWAPEVDPGGNRLIPRFVLGQLARVPPFNGWAAFNPYRTRYGIVGVRAIVLAEKSAGKSEDIRMVEALILPREDDSTASAILTEGFHAERSDLERPLEAVKRLLSARGLAVFLAQWLVSGRRPYPRWFAAALFLGWAAVSGMVLLLLFGPEPGNNLFLMEAGLVALWLGLMLTALAAVVVQAWRAWQTAVALRIRLETSQVRLRMNGGLTLRGGSAG